MKTWIGAVAIALVCATSAMAAEKWTVKELKVAQDVALETFKKDLGDKMYEQISGYAIEKNIQGTAGKAAITYVKGEEKVTVKYFCHYHEEDEIDCH